MAYCPDYMLEPPLPTPRQEWLSERLLRLHEIAEENHQLRRLYRQNSEEARVLRTALEEEGFDIAGL